MPSRSFILNVNDDEATRYMVSRLLQAAGYAVREAATGLEALELARLRPLLVVLDVRLPDISGLEVCRRLKADPATASVPVLQTSATFVSAERRVEGLESGADGYLVQPIEPPELIATVRALLRAHDAEEGLRDAAVEWQRTFDAIGDGVALLDARGRVLRCNGALTLLVRATEREIVGCRIEEVLPRISGLDSVGVVGDVQHSRRRVAAELRAEHHWYRVVADPMLRDVEGTLERIVLVISDITDLKHLEAEHRQRAEELLEENRRKDEFLAMLAHELRNPLNAIAGANSLQERVGAQDSQNVKLRATITRQTRQLARLVDDLLEVSRMTRGKLQLQREPMDLTTVIRAAAQTAHALFESRQQRLDVRCAPGPLPVDADSMRIEQALLNLLNNAAKYSEPGTRIRLECEAQVERDGGTAVIRVADEGVGIAPDMLEAIFDPFVQGDQSLARTLGGLGIGLTIARRMVEMHGGSLTARSEGVGKGAEFIVRLPLLREAVPADPVQRVAPGSGASTPRLNILIVEDNSDAAEMLQALLESWGHQVSVASDGIAGLDAALTIRPDIAFIDIGLPGIDGYQMAENLRASPIGRSLYLVALTGYGRPEDRARALEAGFDLHMVKPIDLQQVTRIFASRELRHRARTGQVNA